MGSNKLFNRLGMASVVSFLTLTSVTSSALVWDIEVIDSHDDDIGYCSMALDSSGYPHIAYARDSGVFELIYKRFNGSDWETEVVDDEDCRRTSITLDSSGNPYIAYTAEVYEDGDWWLRIKCAYYNGSNWEIDIVEEIQQGNCLGNEDVCIQLDSNGYPNITFIQRWWQITWGDYLKFGYYDGSNWHVGFILYDPDWEYEATGIYHSFVFDSANYFHILFGIADILEWTYGLGHKYGDDWSEWPDYLSVDGWYSISDRMWSYCSLDIDANDCLHASYSNLADNYIGYAYYDGNDWDVTPVDTVSGTHTSIAIDVNNRPHIIYQTNGDLKYAYNNGATWYITTLDDEFYGYSYGRFNSIRVDAYSLPHIVYRTYEEGTFYLKYARCLGNDPPSSFNLSQPLDGGEVVEPVTLDWEDSTDDDGDTITYDVWYATDPSFDPHDEVTELTDSTYTFSEGVLSDGTTYYWKVRAWDGWDETWSGPDPYWSFTVDNELDVPVTKFSAESARDGVELTWECAEPGVGFNLYRSEEATDMRTKLREMINAKLITGESPYSYLDAAIESGVTYSYWLEAIDVGGSSETFGPATCTAGTFVPTAYALYQSRPNPARGTAIIAFDLPEDADVTLTVYDLSGRKVTTLVNETLPAGAHERPVAGLAPGVYVYRLAAGEFSGVRKMVVVE